MLPLQHCFPSNTWLNRLINHFSSCGVIHGRRSSQVSAKAACARNTSFRSRYSIQPINDAINVKCSSNGDVSANEFWSLLGNGYVVNPTLAPPARWCPLPQHDVCSVPVLRGWRAQGVRLESLHIQLAASALKHVLCAIGLECSLSELDKPHNPEQQTSREQ
jgi:hypothetical protein